MKTYPITVSMTPAYYDKEHMLLRAQLKCLSLQTVKDFDVWMIDPHYQKRRTVIPELAERFKLDIKHVPYVPATHVAKKFDCAIFNAAFCYSQSAQNARYSCWRFARPGWVEAIATTPPGVNTDFHMLAVGEGLYDPPDAQTSHHRVWNFEGEDVHWDQIPCQSGFKKDGTRTGNRACELGNWRPFSDYDTAPGPVPMNLNGNIAWYRDQWLAINGVNEVITNSSHWEDFDFNLRANMAGQLVMRRTHLLYRLHHGHGSFSQRSSIQVDVPFKAACAPCNNVFLNCSDWGYSWKLMDRVDAGDFRIHDCAFAWVCKACGLSGAFYSKDGIVDSYFPAIRLRRMIKAPVLPSEMIGRNLAAVCDRMDKANTIEAKFAVYTDTWTNPDYYGT